MTPEETNRLRAKVMHTVSGLVLDVAPEEQTQALEVMFEAALTMLAGIAPQDLEVISYRVISKARAASVNAAPPSWRPIVVAVAERHGLTIDDLLGGRRTQDVSEARHEAMWVIRNVLKDDGNPRWSLPTIGRIFNRDHTTVLWGVRAHQALLDAAARDAARSAA